MGANQSVHSTQEINDASRLYEKHPISTMDGQKTLTAKTEVPQEPLISDHEEDANAEAAGDDVVVFSEDDDDDDDDEETDDDGDDEEEDEGLMERRMILEDARKLRQVAEYYYHPELPVEVDATAFGRCYFSRFSAPEQVSSEEMEACDVALADALKLKKLAVDYLHPERPVEDCMDGTCFGRNYFGRPSAPETEDEDDAEEHERILEDAKKLKIVAEWYLQPEKPVVSDGFASGRNYFTRSPAPQFETDLGEEELVLADAMELKKIAGWYLHPEKPVEVDAAATGRNYFSRVSAPEYEDEDDMEEKDLIMSEMKHLKMTAEWYLQPEKPVAMDGFAYGRNYFTRASAPEYDEEDMAEERDLVLADASELKKVAQWYLQPEKPVSVDAASFGRNYFTRGSAPDFSDEDSVDDEERELILAEAKKLKTIAEWYLQPEKSVESDGFASGRNYFSRPSAPEYEEVDSEDHELILKDIKLLKMTAEWYLQPEKPVVVDPCATGRNYFTRPSAQDYEDDEADAERDLILADALELKKIAGWYLHPEIAVVVDSTVKGRNFFSRPSAPEYDEDEAREYELVLAEARTLKKVAEWYLQPEKPVVSEGTASGRNYFARPSATEYDDEEDIEERDAILAEAKELKKVADWYLHPEKPVVSDGVSMGRNYFSRPSASQYNDEETDKERERVLFEAKELKKLADWYMHPEKPVATDPKTMGRNYFSRPSAPEFDGDAEERELILEEAMKLKKIAEWYLRPEKPVLVDDAFITGRNFFSRPSAHHGEECIKEERELVLADANELKKMAEWFMQPEKPVVNNDAFSMGRNFFTRPSAPESDEALYEERECILGEAMELKRIAEWYLHPEKPVTTDASACGRNYFSRPAAPEYEDLETSQERERILLEVNELKQVAEWYHKPEIPVTSSIAVTRNFFSRPSAEEGLDNADEEEKELILADAMRLKKLANDYLHPEMPVESSINCARNYFDRPSAKGHSDHIHSEGHAVQVHELTAQHLNQHHTAANDYYHQYHYNYADDDDHSHHTQSDHFEMDEDVFHEFRESLYAVQEHMVPIIKECEDGEEGKLSRSPSTVMLFDEAM